jgi:hypothetical protein
MGKRGQMLPQSQAQRSLDETAEHNQSWQQTSFCQPPAWEMVGPASLTWAASVVAL